MNEYIINRNSQENEEKPGKISSGFNYNEYLAGGVYPN
jgi:hypothetical protein